MRFCWMLGLAAVLVATSCAGRRAPAGRPPPHRTSAPPQARTAAAVSRLARELEAVVPPRDVLAGLDAGLRSDLEGVLRRLPADERAKLVSHEGVRSPLFHVAAGGTDPDAFYALATGAATNELYSALALTRGSRAVDLVPALAALVAAAGRAHVAAVAPRIRAAPSAALCERIDRVAAAFGDVELRRLAREAAFELEPTPERRIELARAFSWQLEPARARALVSDLDAKRREQVQYRELELLIAAAELVMHEQRAPDATRLLDVARALLTLGRARDAVPILARRGPGSADHLGFETVAVLVELEGSACPGVPAGSETPLICAAAWQKVEQQRPPGARLERAWASGKGRDVQAIEAYLGLSHVLPWVSAAAAGTDSAEARSARARALEGAVREAAASAPGFEGLLLFVEALRAGLAASAARQPRERVRFDEAVQRALSERALRLARPDASPLAAAGVLAVAALLMQDLDVEPIIAGLPAELPARHARARAELRLWSSVARARETLEAARAELVAAAGGGPSGAQGLDTSEAVLALAEADVATSGAGAGERLLTIASRLTDEGLPHALSWRARLDRAGVLARSGRTGEASAELLPIVSAAASATDPSDRNLQIIARVYRAVLEVREAGVADRKRKLDELGREVTLAAESAPPSVVLWAESWQKALRAGTLGYCTRGRGCQRGPGAVSNPEVERRVGAELGRLLARGVLPLGSVSLSFSYSVARGIEPVISVAPCLLAVELAPGLQASR